MHDRRYNFTLKRDVEIISARHAASGTVRPLVLARRGTAAWGPSLEDSGAALDASVPGRAVISLPDATLLVAPGWTAHSLPIGGWLLERDA
jgi:N-methylhydantoinase A